MSPLSATILSIVIGILLTLVLPTREISAEDNQYRSKWLIIRGKKVDNCYLAYVPPFQGSFGLCVIYTYNLNRNTFDTIETNGKRDIVKVPLSQRHFVFSRWSLSDE